jgi:hypothetical protein
VAGWLAGFVNRPSLPRWPAPPRSSEACERGEAWKDAFRNSLASYDDEFQAALRKELAKGVTELGAAPVAYELDESK